MHLISLAYEGHPITIRDDGWFNATQAAIIRGKRVEHWLDNNETLEYIQALDEAISGKTTAIVDTRNSGYVKTSRSRVDRGGGTWLHPKLAVRFAQWLDARFGVWCDMRIAEVMKQVAESAAGEYLPTYRALHQRVNDLAVNSSNKKFVHVNLNKLINSTVGIQTGQRHGLPLPRKSLLIVAQAAATQAMEAANDHHDGYQLAKAAMGSIRPVAQQLAGQPVLSLR
jgi:hypothetical protein